LSRIRQLYDIEHAGKTFDAAARQSLRQEQAAPHPTRQSPNGHGYSAISMPCPPGILTS
jgi:hypothetical protein